MADDVLLETYQAHRALLFGVAYRMLGRVADAEDVVQDAWPRWSAADRSEVRDPRAYLVRIVTRLAIDRLREHATRRETYVGPWLPEPLPTDAVAPAATAPDGADRALLADTVSYAVLLLMESLSPLERAVFVLREAFGLGYPEIAEALGRDQPAVRQLAVRARRHMAERRPRYPVDARDQRALTERFLAAALHGDMAALLDTLAADVTLVADSGGHAKAPRRTIEGVDKVSRFLEAVGPDAPAGLVAEFTVLNGAPGVYVHGPEGPYAAMLLEFEDGLVRRIYLVNNPGKLGHLAG
ncbi:sigma-70 family RNA polymerase sigma factor [Streptomyces sp. 3MP-14]|uniref:Sigma-70 family RNA polymerase sigma factor n=1 Tax=Streptomyces mimosae TaxID=2586635 RepID=A0A5N5ZYX7_9ACTN|nr:MULTISPECIES: RNA polymerase sigma factor SigJ [Streptomyces]KAB8160318.1 sigma-70 family RNA polymerase sigma factor [Streptomyces mimosae]KAB8172920.1 sigma-70 family RNA polymerase sigma factor [Streptomyces sp. 3MP-14]